jgi:transposase
MHLMRKRSELLVHIQNTNSQYCLPQFGKKIAYKKNRQGVAEHFTDSSVRKSIEMDLALIDHYDKLLTEVELYITQNAKIHNVNAFQRLRSVHGIGKILALVILYEIHEIDRFPTVQDFVSYARLVKCSKESAGKRHGSSGAKIGNVHLKWAFSEASVLFLRDNPPAQRYLDKLASKHGKAKALSILAHKLGRAVYYMLKRDKAFDMNKFLVS